MAFKGHIMELVEDYLDGRLDQRQLLEFEQMMRENPEMVKEVKSQRELVETMKHQARRLRISQQMHEFHQEMLVPEQEKQNRHIWLWRDPMERRRILASAAIAASISLLIALGTIFSAGWFGIRKQVSAYTQMKQDIHDISSRQVSIWNFITSEKKSDSKRNAVPTGTGFVISDNGYLLTNYHVVSNADSVLLINYFDQQINLKASVVMKDYKNDLAILLITDTNFIGFNTLPYAFGSKVADLGENVYTLGYSKQDLVYGEGAVSSMTGYMEDTTSYEVSIPVNPGNSGGPLLDLKGNCIGVICGKHSQKEGATFALKSSYLLQIVDSINAQDNLVKLKLPQRNRIQWMKKTDQIKSWHPYIFKVEVYN